MISPNEFDFDAVIDALDRGETPDGVDVFDMSTVAATTDCGTAACLFGSAAIAAGYSTERARDAFHEWRTDDPRLDAIRRLCNMHRLTAAQVVTMYRGIADDGRFDLTDADLRNVYLRGADMRGTNLTDADLGGAILIDANLTGAYLTDAILIGANLTGANLTGADLYRANMYHADLRNANMRGARYDDDTVFPAGFDPEAAGMILFD